MDQLLLSMPPNIVIDEENYWLHVQATLSKDCWQAFYGDVEGVILQGYSEQGKTPLEAVQKLKQTTDLLNLFRLR